VYKVSYENLQDFACRFFHCLQNTAEKIFLFKVLIVGMIIATYYTEKTLGGELSENF